MNAKLQSDNDIAFGKYLLNVLDRRGITQAALAEKAHTSQPVISAICHGKRKCGLRLALKIVNALELTGKDRDDFLSQSKKPQWKGFDHEIYGYEAMLYDFLVRELRAAGVDTKDIASITNLEKIEGQNASKVIFVMKDGTVYSLNLSVTKAVNSENNSIPSVRMAE